MSERRGENKHKKNKRRNPRDFKRSGASLIPASGL